MNVWAKKETLWAFLQKHWQNGNILTISVGVFTFLLFVDAHFIAHVYNVCLSIAFKFGLKSFYDYLYLTYPGYHRLIFRTLIGGLFIATFVASIFILLQLWEVFKKGILQKKAAAFIGVNVNERYEIALFRQFAVCLCIFALYVLFYYALNYFIHDTAIFYATQLTLTWLLMLTLIFQFYVSIYAVREQLPHFASSYFLEPLSVYNLAIFRIFLCIGLLMYYVYRIYIAAYWAAMPQSARVDLPYMGWFIQNIPISPEIYLFVGKFGIVLATMAMVGFLTRPALILNIPISIYILGVPMFFGKLSHQQIWVWFPAILAFSRCGDVLSVDWFICKYIRKKTLPDTTISPRYGLPFKFIWLHFGIIYFFAGIMKLRQCGLDWALGKSMINQIQLEWLQNYDMIPAFRIDHYPLIAYAGGLGVIIMELFYPFLILAPLTRIISFAAGLSFHNFAAYFMNIGFGDLQITNVSYINFAWIGNWVKEKTFGLKTVASEISDRAQLSFSDFWKLPDFKAVFILGTFLFSINFMCGLLRIHSWPFSSYPTYSRLVYDYHWYVYYDVFDKQKNHLNLYELGKQANHRMETYTPLEDRIYENYFGKDTVTLRKNASKLWEIWIDNVPALKENADSVVVYLRKSPIAPEIKDSILEEYPLAKIVNGKTLLLSYK